MSTIDTRKVSGLDYYRTAVNDHNLTGLDNGYFHRGLFVSSGRHLNPVSPDITLCGRLDTKRHLTNLNPDRKRGLGVCRLRCRRRNLYTVGTPQLRFRSRDLGWH